MLSSEQVENIAREVAEAVVNDLRREVDELRIDMETVDTQLSDRLANDVRILNIRISSLGQGSGMMK